jgi:hypothetical protein
LRHEIAEKNRKQLMKMREKKEQNNKKEKNK